MKYILILTAIFATTVQAQSETYITPSGTYMTSQVGSTTYVIQTSKTSNNSNTVAPVVVPQGNGTVITSSGSYMTVRNGSTTTVIQTSRTK
jgi:hypothetical protein